MIRIEFPKDRPAIIVTCNGITYVDNEAAIRCAIKALKEAVPKKTARINVRDRATFAAPHCQLRAIEINDLEDCVEVYLDHDGEDYPTFMVGES